MKKESPRYPYILHAQLVHVQRSGSGCIAPYSKHLPIGRKKIDLAAAACINGNGATPSGSTNERWGICFYDCDVCHGYAGNLLSGYPHFIQEKRYRAAPPSGHTTVKADL